MLEIQQEIYNIVYVKQVIGNSSSSSSLDYTDAKSDKGKRIEFKTKKPLTIDTIIRNDRSKVTHVKFNLIIIVQINYL